MTFSEHPWIFDPGCDPSRESEPAAKAAIHAAILLTSFYRNNTLTPECLLLALAQDDQVRRHWASPRALDELLEAQILSGDPPGDENGWSGPAQRAMDLAWDRADARRGMVSCGDLLFGLAGAGGVAGEAVGRVSPPYSTFDESRGPGAERRPLPCKLGDGCVAILDDPTTPMDLVVTILREVFACSQPRAIYLMYRIHHLGEARLGPFADLALRVERARSTIAAAGFPLRIETSQDSKLTPG